MQIRWTKLIQLTPAGVARIKEVAGVYRLCYRDASENKYYVYYVGQAENLNERLTEHLPGNEKNDCCNRYLENYTCYFRAAVVSRQSDRDGIEVALYYHYNKPSCVERIPDADPIDVNFD